MPLKHRPLLQRAKERLMKRHSHDWEYLPKTIGGWGVAVCRGCGLRDIY